MLYIDILLIILIVVLVIMITSGIVSLLERKVMATIQNRIGPSYFLNGLCTPVFDGIKLVLKFNLIIIQIEIFYLFLILVSSLFFNYIIIFIIPLSSIMIYNMDFNIFFILAMHVMLSVINSFLVGCFIINTCFVYIGTMRHIISTLVSELGMLYIIFTLHTIHNESFLNLQYIGDAQLHIKNIYSVTALFLSIFIILLLLSTNVGVFEYIEAESELVAGIITEYSGLFFCIASLLEIFHVLVSAFLLVVFVLSYIYITFTSIVVIVTVFVIPKICACKIKINNMVSFFLFYIYSLLIQYFFIYLTFKLLYVYI